MNKGILLALILVSSIILTACSEQESVKSVATDSQRTDCKESHGACLKIIESSYRHNPIGDYDEYEIIGQVQNVGTAKNNYNPWHGIKGSCYYQGKLVDEGGSTFELLEPNETTTFKIGLDGHGQPVDECRAKIDY